MRNTVLFLSSLFSIIFFYNVFFWLVTQPFLSDEQNERLRGRQSTSLPRKRHDNTEQHTCSLNHRHSGLSTESRFHQSFRTSTSFKILLQFYYQILTKLNLTVPSISSLPTSNVFKNFLKICSSVISPFWYFGCAFTLYTLKKEINFKNVNRNFKRFQHLTNIRMLNGVLKRFQSHSTLLTTKEMLNRCWMKL